MLNRGVLILRPKQPFIDWAKSLTDDEGLAPDPSGEQTAYLIPDCESEEELADFLDMVHGDLFERELGCWGVDPATWPEERNLTMFHDWFQIEVHTVVEDLVADELVDDEFDGEPEAEPGGDIN